MICSCSYTGGSASTARSSKNRSAAASCKTCGGEVAIGGKGSPSSSMLGGVGLELSSLVNSDLTWNKVSKGNRSSSRRARKSVEINFKGSGELVNKGPRELEMPISESEKQGVTVLGCRFSEKASHIPIKKRRYLFRSSSPPPRTPSPRPEGTERLVKSQHASGQGFHYPKSAKQRDASGQIVDSDCKIDAKTCNVSNDIEDFSGIAILAAAACSNLLEEDVDCNDGSGAELSGKKDLGVIYNEFKEDTVASAEMTLEGTGSLTPVVLPEGAANEGTFSETNSLAPSQGPLGKKDEETSRTQESSARCSRLHWDLNTVMEEWEQPYDCYHVSSPTTAKSVDTCTSKEKVVAASEHVGHVDTRSEHSADSQTAGTSSSRSQADKQEVSFMLKVCSEKAMCDDRTIASKDGGGVMATSGLLDDENSLKNLISLDTAYSLKEPLDDIKQADTGNSLQSSHALIKMPASGPILAAEDKGQRTEVSLGFDTATDVRIDAQELPLTEPSGKSLTLLRPSCAHNLDEIRNNFSNVLAHSSSRATVEVPLDSGYRSDASQSDLSCGGGIEKLNEFQVEYDSQYEDGELRDSSVHTWDEYDGEDGETDRVEYETANKETGSLATGIAQESKLDNGTGATLRLEPSVSQSGRTSAVARRQVAKESSQSAILKISGWDQLPENCRSSLHMVTRISDGSRTTSTHDRKDGMDAEDAETNMNNSRDYRRDFLPSTERPTPRSGFFRRDRLSIQEISSNDADDSYPRFEKESGHFKSFGRGKSSMQFHARSRQRDHWAGSTEGNRGLNRHQSPTYQGPTAFRRSGPDDGNIRNSGGFMHRSFSGGLPTGRQDGFRMRNRPSRDVSPDRSVSVGRGRSVRYGSRINGGGPRGRYYGHAYDDCSESSLDYSNSLTRRMRSFSPNERRGNLYAHQSSSRSRSRSRSRSPITWQAQRRRYGDDVTGNIGYRHRRRSPHSRYDVRITSTRSPHFRPGFTADQATGFMSAPRNHDSPQANATWSGYKQRSSVSDRRSPERIGPREEKFPSVNSSRRPNMHPGRFSELDGVRRGRPRYEGHEDDGRKYDYRRGFVHPVRHFNMDGAVKRFRHDDEDGFFLGSYSRDKDAIEFNGRGNPKACSRGIDGGTGDLPRRSREERGLFIHERDGKYNADSKFFGTREGVDGPFSRQSSGKYNADSKSSGTREGDDSPFIYQGHGKYNTDAKSFQTKEVDNGAFIHARDGKHNADLESFGTGTREGDDGSFSHQRDGEHNADSKSFGKREVVDAPSISERDGRYDADSKSLGTRDIDEGLFIHQRDGKYDAESNSFRTMEVDDGQFIHQREGICDADSKSFGMREGDDGPFIHQGDGKCSADSDEGLFIHQKDGNYNADLESIGRREGDDGLLIHQKDGKHNPGSESFGTREGDQRDGNYSADVKSIGTREGDDDANP